MRSAGCLLAFLFCVVSVVSAAELRVLPAEIVLSGRTATQQVMSEWYEADVARGVSSDVEWAIADPAVARYENGSVIPVADGRTILTVTHADGTTATASVRVEQQQNEAVWTFRHHVEPVLTRLGCNSGACHGALAGKGGFRLSLRGYDPETDHFHITQQHLGRRIDAQQPGLSLLLTKPTTAVAHKGGKRLDEESLSYRILSQWIASGAAGPLASDAQLQHLEVLPEQVIPTPGTTQPLLVRAVYDNGQVRDVTQWARFTSSRDSVAQVDDDGIVTVVGPGEGAVTVQFASQLVIARITVPFDQQIPETVYEQAPRNNLIDDQVLQQLQQLNLSPSPRSDDTVFVRRAFLDTIGVLPTAAEVREFLEDPSPDKRTVLIDQLLQRPEFVDFWSYQWSDLLMVNGILLRQEPLKAYYQWIQSHVKHNTPWDQLVRELVTAKGSSIEQGATNFYALHQTPEDMAENISQAFLGLSIGCARCHNHPLEKWTNDQYYAFANLFSRVRAKGWGGDPRGGDGIRTVITVASGELVQPRTGQPQLPTPLDGTPVEFDDPADRRQHLADWLVSDRNPLFARSITNRVWRNFMGVGLVEQVDDMRASNPASNEQLLTDLSHWLVQHDYDLKALMRLILQSETYQRSSRTLPENVEDGRHYSRWLPRRLTAEVMLDAVSQVTGVSTTFNEIAFPGGDVQKTGYYEEGTRALQLYDSAVKSYFLRTFGRNQRRITCECERSNDPSMIQVLHLSNGTTLNDKLAHAENSLTTWQSDFAGDDSGLLDEMFLTAVARYPSPQERSELLNELQQADSHDDRRLLLEDILWSILSSREFLFTH